MCSLLNTDTTTAVGNVFRDTFVTDGDISNNNLHDMAEAWIDIEDNEDMINEIVDDELLLVDAIVNNDKNLDSEDDDDEEIVQFETSTEKKLYMWKFLTHTWLKTRSCQKNTNYHLVRFVMGSRHIAYTSQRNHQQ